MDISDWLTWQWLHLIENRKQHYNNENIADFGGFDDPRNAYLNSGGANRCASVKLVLIIKVLTLVP